MRKAVQAAADFQPMMQAAYGASNFYRLDPSLYFKETKWWSDSGKAFYNQNNPVKARRLLRDAGYHGQAVRILSTHQYDYFYKLAVVLQGQLKAIGMDPVLDVVDWATMNQRMGDPGAYDIYISSYPNFYEPGAGRFGTGPGQGGGSTPEKDSLLMQLATELDDKKRLGTPVAISRALLRGGAYAQDRRYLRFAHTEQEGARPWAEFTAPVSVRLLAVKINIGVRPRFEGAVDEIAIH